jgi:hypothetical protein
MEELLNRGVCICQVQTSNFIIFFAWYALKRYKSIHQIPLLVAPILHIGGEFRASTPEYGHQKGYERYNKGDHNDLQEATGLGMVDAFHSPHGQVLIGRIEDGTNASSHATNNDEKSQLPDGKIGGFSAATRAQRNWLDRYNVAEATITMTRLQGDHARNAVEFAQ